MPVDPQQRAGKGKFEEPAQDQQVDTELTDSVLKKAQARTVLFDYLHMIVVGFLSTLKGLLGFNTDESSK